MAEILERIVKKLNRIKEADKVRSKAKEAAVENIVFINGKKKSPTKRQKVYCTYDKWRSGRGSYPCLPEGSL